MRILTLAAIASLSATVLAQTPAPAAAAAAKPKATHVDFKIPMKPLKQADLSFSMLRNRWSFILYFSPTCGHCRHTYPLVRQFRDKYEKKGMAFVAIASGFSTQEDIADFDQELHLDMIAFQDTSKKFGQLYGTGSVPLMLLVSPDGSYQMWNASDSATLASVESAIRKSLKVK